MANFIIKVKIPLTVIISALDLGKLELKILIYRFLDRSTKEISTNYRPPTKMREGNIFIGVCLSTRGGYLWYQVPLGVCRVGYVQGLGMSRGGGYIWGGVFPGEGYPPQTWDLER